MALAAMLVGSATAFNAGSPLPLAGTRPVAISRAGAVIAHDTAPLTDAATIMDARLDPQVAQGPFGKGGSLEWLAKLTDAWAELALAQLHAFDDKAVQDSSKNLQVLWSRALLAHNGQLKDPIAFQLLPKSTRWFIQSGAIDFAAPWLEWIQARTEWLDQGTEAFLSSPCCAGGKQCQVVIIGAGFDTRSIRYQREGLRFFEVDLPETIDAKRCVHERYRDDVNPQVNLPTLVGMDLNDCEHRSLLSHLTESYGFKQDAPTLFISEAVLFYVNPQAIKNFFDEIFAFGQHEEAMYCFTDSMRPFVDGPFADEIKTFVEDKGAEVLQHTARWGGAVQFVHGVARTPGASALRDHVAPHSTTSTLPDHLRFTPPLNSYAPERLATVVDHTAPFSFNNSWYAIAYGSELRHSHSEAEAEREAPYATRLFGEALRLRRDASGTVTCTSTATATTTSTTAATTTTATTATATASTTTYTYTYAVEEHQGLLYVWRGDPDHADPSLLPTHPTPEMTHAVETILDYGCDWTYIVENNLDTPHLYWLHDGSIPPIESLGCSRENVGKIGLKFFKDDVGVGHIGKTSKKVTKVVRYDAPNVVRHGGVSGFSEEFNIIPLGPHRTRVLLRQRFPKGPILSTMLGVPGFSPLLTYLVRSWNYQIGVEDYSVMQGQAHNINDLGAPNYGQLGTGDDLIVRFWEWKRAASQNDAGGADAVRAAAVDGSPEYFTRWDGSAVEMEVGVEARLLSEARQAKGQHAAAHTAQQQTAAELDYLPTISAELDYLRPHYTQQQPVAAYPPVNFRLEKLPARYLTEVPEKLMGFMPQVGATLTAAFAARAVTASDLSLDETLQRGTSVLMAMNPF